MKNRRDRYLCNGNNREIKINNKRFRVVMEIVVYKSTSEEEGPCKTRNERSRKREREG